MVKELGAFLINLQIKPSFIFVGHSLGGLIGRYFYNTYPDKVKAMVLFTILE